MATIIDGTFQQQAQAERAMSQLMGAGFRPDKTSVFFVNPAGQHDLHPIGGDQPDSPGAVEAKLGSASGAAVGGAIGLAAGLAAAPIVGPVATIAASGAGAYAGSLIGALVKTDEADRERTAHGGEVQVADEVRKSGVLVAVAAMAASELSTAIRILRECGATDIERCEGEIQDGKWTDFDVLANLHRIDDGGA